MLRPGEVGFRVERAKDGVLGDPGIEPADERLEEWRPAGSVVEGERVRRHGPEDSRDQAAAAAFVGPRRAATGRTAL